MLNKQLLISVAFTGTCHDRSALSEAYRNMYANPTNPKSLHLLYCGHNEVADETSQCGVMIKINYSESVLSLQMYSIL